MNKEYILDRIKPYLNAKGMLPERDFENLFSRMTKEQQYNIIEFLIEASIDIDYEEGSYNSCTHQNIITNQINTYQDSMKFNKLSNEQLCVIYQRGSKIALEALVKKNTRLVWSRAIKYSRRYKHKLDVEDIVQYGIMGLIIAANKFDAKKEAKFSTYAIWWMDQQIIRNIADYGFTIRLPVHYFAQVNSLLSIFSQNPDCTKQQIIEIAKTKGISREKFEEINMILESIVSLASLNTCVGDEEESELGDFKVDDLSPSVEDLVEYSILKETVASVLETLCPKEKDVIEKRFGLNNGIARTLEQIGAEYKVTRERIRQIEAKAIKKLRHPSRSKKLRSFYRGES